MAELKINENPSITDTVIFELEMPGADGNLNPEDFYKVENLTIYYVERNFKNNSKQFDDKIYDPVKMQTLQRAEQEYSIDPTAENLTILQEAQRDYEAFAFENTFFYEQAQPVHILGTTNHPAWIYTDTEASLLEKIELDDDGKSVPLYFKYYWKPDQVREGDYFICWTWAPSELAPTETLSAHLRFWLNGNTQVTTSIPSHFTDPNKYPTLLERYTPELFKLTLSEDDRTPDVIDKFNQAVALGFKNLEDLANQVVDLLDANAIHESLLPYLSNIFGLKLKSIDPTKWRGQIKRAIPLYKSKGTRSALNEAFKNASMELLDLTIPWQIVSSYHWQESFVINQSDNFSWTSEFAPLEIKEAWLRRKVNNYEWEELSLGFVDFDTVEKKLILTYVAIDFTYGEDEIRFLYRFGEPPDEPTEDYLLTLPLMDNRDDPNIIYPYKNWNVRLIEESDPLFDVFIPQKQPFCNPIVYGKIRTEFPYSENVYNMEEYNGSNRDSKVPCDIDRFFVDKCSACRSSCYNVDLEIENLSDDRVFEAQDILKEFMPFHAVLSSVSFRGTVNDFTQSPLETITLAINQEYEQITVNNENQFWFNRITGEFTRNDLATLNTFNPIYQISEIAVSGVSTTEITVSNDLGHNLVNGDYVYIQGTDSDETIDGFWQVTYVDENTFSIETDVVTVAGSSGTVSKIEYQNIEGIGYNDEVMVYCPATRLDVIGMRPDSFARMQITAPIGLAGFYTVKDPVGKTMVVELDSGVPDPQSEPITDPMTFFENDGGDIILNESTFTFNLINLIADGEGLCSVNQDNVVMFGDENNDFRLLSIQTNKNSATPWKISISGTDFLIEDFLPDGRLVLGEGSPVDTLQSLTSTSNITYGIKNFAGSSMTWKDPNGNTVSSSNTGEIEVFYRGRVTPADPTLLYPGIGPTADTVDSGDYYFFINTTEYRISGFEQDSVSIFYIENYDSGDLGSSVNLRINKRILTNEIGYFSYQGMKVQVDGDLETDLEIQDGANSLVPEDERVQNDRLKENFIIFIDDVPYFMTDIDGNNVDFPGKTIISLSGLRKYWKKIDAGGTAITLSIYNYIKENITPTPVFNHLPEITFENIDRSGPNVYEEITLLDGLSALSDESGPVDYVKQSEKISFKIEYKQDDTN